MKRILSLTIISISLNSFGANMKHNEIVYFNSTDAEAPWLQDAAADTRYTFNTAVLGLLVHMDSSFNIKPMCLESFQWDYQNKYYVLTLKSGLKFTNGRNVTIEDLEFSILRPFFAATKNQGTMHLINLKGSEKIKPGQAYQSGLVDGIKILNENSLAVVPSSPNPSFMYTLARSNYSLVPIEEFKEDLLNWKKWPVGVGPYKVTSEDRILRNYSLELVDEKNYPEAPKKIIFALEKNQKTDLTLKDASIINDISYKHTEFIAPLGIRFLAFNYSTKLGNNPDFRKAVNLALTRKPLTNMTYVPTKVLNEIVTRGVLGRINIEENHKKETAKKLFQKILGIQQNNVFKIPYTRDQEYLGDSYRNAIAQQLNEAGLRIEFIKSEVIWDVFQGDFKDSPFRMLTKGADFYDPLSTFTIFKKNSPLLNTYPNDDHLEQLMEEAKGSLNRDLLGKNVKKLSEYFIDQNIIIPILEIPSVAYFNPKKIKSVGEQFGGQTFHLANIIMQE